MEKVDYWFWAMVAMVIALAIVSICGCGDILQAGGHVLKAGGETVVFVGEHLTDTGTK